MTTVTESFHAGEYLLSEGNGSISREQVVITGGNYPAGTVLGKGELGIGGAPVPAVVGTGNGVMTNVEPGPDAEVGNYVLTCITAATHGGVFSVVAPDGSALPPLTLTPGAGGTTHYHSSHIEFDITDGSTDFAVDDVFTIVISTTPPVVVGTGNGVMSAVSLGPLAKSGTYRFECIAAVTNGGTFSVRDPDGNLLPDFVLTAGAGTTTAYDQEQIKASITDGSTDFAVGDFFHMVAFNQVTQKYTQFDPATFGGAHKAAAILYEAVDASAADADGVIHARQAEVNDGYLTWKTGISVGDKAAGIAALATHNIIVRA